MEENPLPSSANRWFTTGYTHAKAAIAVVRVLREPKLLCELGLHPFGGPRAYSRGSNDGIGATLDLALKRIASMLSRAQNVHGEHCNNLQSARLCHVRGCGCPHNRPWLWDL
jgi:hypothetical protein